MLLAMTSVVTKADAMFKCLGSDGMVSYQSTKCEAGSQSEQLVTKQTSKATSVNAPHASLVNISIDPNIDPIDIPIADDLRKKGFFTTSIVEGLPVTMLITTAVSGVELPATFAQKIGIRCGPSKVTVNTQGGNGSCQSRVNSMLVGNLTFANVEVTIRPYIYTSRMGQAFFDRMKAGGQSNGVALSPTGVPHVQLSRVIHPHNSPQLNPHLMGGAIQGGELQLGNFVTTFAGVATVNGSTDGAGRGALFNWPFGIATDGTNLYIADFTNRCIRKIVIATGIVTTLAGKPRAIGSVDGTGAAATFDFPQGITTDGTNLYVTDVGNHNIRKIVIATGVVTTLAGIAKNPGKADGIGTAATFNYPWGITTDGVNLYVTDDNNATIRKIEIASGVVTTLAGRAGFIGHADGAGASATFYNPYGITTDGTNLYVSDSYNNTIRKIVISSGVVTTLAGAWDKFGNIDGTGSEAMFYRPSGITTDGTNLYVADNSNNSIRKIVINTGAVTTLAGVPMARGHADGENLAASFTSPYGITADGKNLYVTDTVNATIRKFQ
jgi:hypothetical protein